MQFPDLRRFVWLVALAGLALAVRVWGLTFGLPLLSNYYIRPDETLVVVPALELFARHGNPGHIDYPAGMISLLAVIYQPLHALLAAAGHALPSLVEDAGANPSRYFLIGRFVSACAGALTTMAVYGIGRRLMSTRAAIVAALWYAVAPLAVRDAHFAVTDTLLGLLVAAAVLCAQRVGEAEPSHRRRALLLSAVVAGAAVATKYNAIVILPALVLALASTEPPGQRLRMAAAWLLTAAITFALLNPWLMLHPELLVHWIVRIATSIYTPREELVVAAQAAYGWPGWWDYFGLAPGGHLGALLAIAGLAIAAWRGWRQRDPRLLAPLLVTLAFLVLFAPAFTLPFRYLAPLLPLVAVWSALALDVMTQHVPRRAAVTAMVGAAGLVATMPAAWHLDRSLALEDTRTTAGRWIRANVPPSVPIVWLGMPESEPQLLETADSIDRRIAWVDHTYGLVAARVIDRIYLLSQPAAPADGHELYRNPRLAEVPAGLICVVQARYPSPTVVTDSAALDAWTRGRIVVHEQIGAPLPDGKWLLEPWDAFFLPLNLDRMLRPGPQFDIYLVERE